MLVKLTKLLVATLAINSQVALSQFVDPKSAAPVPVAVPVAAIAPQATRETVKVGLKTLILSGQELLTVLPKSVIDKSGGKYQQYILTPGTDTVPLYDDQGNGLYNSIVMTDIDCAAWDPRTGLWPSGISPKFQNDLTAYRLKFNVRMVYMKSSVRADEALMSRKSMLDQNGYDGTSELAYLEFSDIIDKFPDILSNLNKNLRIKVGKETPFQPPSLRYFWSKFIIDESKNQDDHLIPIMKICSAEPKPDVDPCSLGAFIKTEKNGLQSLHFTFTADVYTLHGIITGDLWYAWVTQGLFLGERRLILGTQVDDMFLQSGIYNIAENRQYNEDIDGERIEGDPKIFRMVGDDVTYLVQWQKRIREKMPLGSNFTIELAYNGKEFNKTRMLPPHNSWSLEARMLAARDEFLWLSHSWDHLDMFCVDSKCELPNMPYIPQSCFINNLTSVCDYTPAGEKKIESWYINTLAYPTSGPTPYQAVAFSLSMNKWFAKNILWPEKSVEDLLNPVKTPNYSPAGLVSPRISGLNYSAAIKAMLDTGIRFAVGDNSRPALYNYQNRYHMVNAPITVLTQDTTVEQAQQLSNAFKVIPRFATRVYFDCSLPEESVAEHNAIYGPDCSGFDSIEPINPPRTRCNKDSFKYNKSLTYEEIMWIESRDVVTNLLKYRHDPYMFHQANLRFFPYKEEWTAMGGRITFPTDIVKKTCLQCLWIDYVVDYIMKYIKFPILTYRMDDLHEKFEQREKRDNCDIEGLLQYSIGKNEQGVLESHLSNLRIKSNGMCEPKVTMTLTDFDVGYEKSYYKLANSDVLSNAGGYSIDKYGPDNTIIFHGANSANNNNTLYYFF